MSRYRGPRVRLQRRLGIRLDDLTKKRIRSRKRQNSLPGQHGYPRRRVRLSEYRMRLEEKQKLRFNYSVSEKQARSAWWIRNHAVDHARWNNYYY